jgi:hypothetical protein
MKPSERIQQFFDEDLGAHFPPGTIPNWETRVRLSMRALSRYLDEQHEREQRRRHVLRALFHTTAKRFNLADLELERAGLSERTAHLREPWEALDPIFAEAEREGLL